MEKAKKLARTMAAEPKTWVMVGMLLQPVLAQAYLGQTMVVGLYKMVGLPVIFISFLWAVGALIFSQQHVSKALYTLVASLVFTGLLFGGDQVMSWLTAAQTEAGR